MKRYSLTSLYKNPVALASTLVLIGLGIVLIWTYLIPKGEQVNTDGYQVVYMTTGQAYFGKLKNTTGEYLVLDNPYTAQDVSPDDSKEEAAQTSTTLLKVSQQQYGPEDVLSLKSDQVLFWQNLRDEGKVTEAIKANM